MLNNFLWTFAKFKARIFAFSRTLRLLGRNPVLGRDLSLGWEQNTWSGLLTASCIPLPAPTSSHHFPLSSAPRLEFHSLVASPRVPRVTWPSAATWMKENESCCNQLGLAASHTIHFLICCSRFASQKWGNKCPDWDRNKMQQSVHRNYHCKTFTRVWVKTRGREIKRILTLANSRANKLNNWSARKTLYLTLLLVIFTPFEVHPSPCIDQFLGHEYTLTQIWANWMMAPELRLTRRSVAVSCAQERRARPGPNVHRAAGPGHEDHNYVESKNAGPIWPTGPGYW